MLKMRRKKLSNGNSLFCCLEHTVVQEGLLMGGLLFPRDLSVLCSVL